MVGRGINRNHSIYYQISQAFKAENIIVDSYCNAKLIDFGLAKKFNIVEN